MILREMVGKLDGGPAPQFCQVQPCCWRHLGARGRPKLIVQSEMARDGSSPSVSGEEEE